MIKAIKTSSTVKFGTAVIAGLSVLLQNKDTILDSMGNPSWGGVAFVALNTFIVVSGVLGLAKFRIDGDDKPLIRDRDRIGF